MAKQLVKYVVLYMEHGVQCVTSFEAPENISKITLAKRAQEEAEFFGGHCIEVRKAN